MPVKSSRSLRLSHSHFRGEGAFSAICLRHMKTIITRTPPIPLGGVRSPDVDSFFPLTGRQSEFGKSGEGPSVRG
jgi:hypothetical protein